jgi:hypothetical protein
MRWLIPRSPEFEREYPALETRIVTASTPAEQFGMDVDIVVPASGRRLFLSGQRRQFRAGSEGMRVPGTYRIEPPSMPTRRTAAPGLRDRPLAGNPRNISLCDEQPRAALDTRLAWLSRSRHYRGPSCPKLDLSRMVQGE